jgi:hypothetical protein
MGLIPVRGNWLGLGMFVVIGGLAALIAGFVLKLGDVKTMIIAGSCLVAADLLIRILNRTEPRWLIGKEAGGYFFFVPVWVLGAVVIVANSLVGLGVIKK